MNNLGVRPLKNNSGSNNYNLYSNENELSLDKLRSEVARRVYWQHNQYIKNSIKTKLQKYDLTKTILNGAQLFHGSTSASLLAFTEYGNFEGKLKPTGVLKNEGKIPFTGEVTVTFNHENRLTGVSKTHISSVSIMNIEDALRYSILFIVNKNNSTFLQNLRNNSSSYISQRILNQYNQLTPLEKNLVLNQFPVIYGIKSDRKNSHHQIRSNINGEIGLLNGTKENEIKIIFVPKNKVNIVEEIVKRFNIKVLEYTQPMLKYIKKEIQLYGKNTIIANNNINLKIPLILKDKSKNYINSIVRYGKNDHYIYKLSKTLYVDEDGNYCDQYGKIIDFLKDLSLEEVLQRKHTIKNKEVYKNKSIYYNLLSKDVYDTEGDQIPYNFISYNNTLLKELKVKLNNNIYYQIRGPAQFKYYDGCLYNINKNNYILFKDYQYYNKNLKKLKILPI